MYMMLLIYLFDYMECTHIGTSVQRAICSQHHYYKIPLYRVFVALQLCCQIRWHWSALSGMISLYEYVVKTFEAYPGQHVLQRNSKSSTVGRQILRSVNLSARPTNGARTVSRTRLYAALLLVRKLR